MESVRDLREICRKKHKKGVTKPHLWATIFARRVSIYITWLIVKYTKISANQVTIWQLVVSFIGLGLLCFANPWIGLLGALLLHLGYIFDNVDGEIARYRKSQSINGMFLDFVNHEIIIPGTFGCLAFHYFFLTGSKLYFGLGLGIIFIRINPVGKARQTTINYLIKKRKSPTYDISNYQFNNKGASSANSINSALGASTQSVLKKLRKVLGEFFSYPNDVIIVSALILIELIAGNTIYGRFSLILFTIYFACNFILDVYVHLKNKVPERELLNYVQACVEIANKFKPVETNANDLSEQ